MSSSAACLQAQVLPAYLPGRAGALNGVGLRSFAVLEIENDPRCDAIQDALLALTGGRSVPRVFVNGQFIGGGDDTAAKAANGTLMALLKECGAL